MSADIISTVEDDLVATLTNAARAAGAKLRVESLPGDWDDDMLKRLLTMAPCLLVNFAGAAPTTPGAGSLDTLGQWVVYVVTSHPSGQAARRRGNAQALGAYELVSLVVLPALHGRTVPNVGTMTSTRIDNLFTGMVERQGLAVYALGFQLGMSFGLDQSAALDDFKTFVAQYDIPPHSSGTEHTNWLQGSYLNSKPDAVDNVELSNP